ncbi:hypothetical protein IWZ00DRAFT_278648 [Phyllosticta capitalensis]|uniref:uncharacterized protein n=1 Tax=Phyllosticta capitalensis TaxID=121624 RepID=UPI003131E4B5
MVGQLGNGRRPASFLSVGLVCKGLVWSAVEVPSEPCSVSVSLSSPCASPRRAKLGLFQEGCRVFFHDSGALGGQPGACRLLLERPGRDAGMVGKREKRRKIEFCATCAPCTVYWSDVSKHLETMRKRRARCR